MVDHDLRSKRLLGLWDARKRPPVTEFPFCIETEQSSPTDMAPLPPPGAAEPPFEIDLRALVLAGANVQFWNNGIYVLGTMEAGTSGQERRFDRGGQASRRHHRRRHSDRSSRRRMDAAVVAEVAVVVGAAVATICLFVLHQL